MSNDGGLSFNELEKIIINDFIIKDQSIKMRINEQIISKNIYFKDNKYFITTSGKRINYINNFVIKIFNL